MKPSGVDVYVYVIGFTKRKEFRNTLRVGDMARIDIDGIGVVFLEDKGWFSSVFYVKTSEDVHRVLKRIERGSL